MRWRVQRGLSRGRCWQRVVETRVCGSGKVSFEFCMGWNFYVLKCKDFRINTGLNFHAVEDRYPKWATAFKILSPPVEDFGKVYHSRSVISKWMCMWYPWGVHVIPMRCACDTHEVCMWYPWGVHAISRWWACDIQKWATPFKILSPPGEDFGKVYHSWSVNFQMHLP